MRTEFRCVGRASRWVAAGVAMSLAGAVGALGGCTSASASSEKIDYAHGRDTVTPDGLHRVKFWEDANGAAFVKPGADIGRYTALILDKVSVAYKRPPRRSNFGDPDDGNFALSPQAMDEIEKYFRKTYDKELSQGKLYTLTDAPAPNALRVVPQIVNLTVNVQPFADQEGDESLYTQSPGSYTMILDVRDSQSGDPLVRLAHFTELDYDTASGFRQSNPVTNSGAVREAFQNEARILRDYLERLRELPEIPEPSSSGHSH